MPNESWNPLLKSYPFSERVNAVSVGAEVLFVRLIAQADDYGNYYGSPRMLLASLFPHRWAKKEVTETDVGRWRAELVANAVGPLAALYSVNGSEYLHLISPRRRLRGDVKPDERFPREPGNIEEKALSEHVTNAGRARDENVPLDPDQDPDQDPEEKESPTDRVIRRLNELREANWTWASFRPLSATHAKNVEHINGRLSDGFTEAQLVLVLEYLAAKDRGDEKSRQFFDCVTPFRTSNFERYLAMAEDWDARGRPDPRRNGERPSIQKRPGTSRGHDYYLRPNATRIAAGSTKREGGEDV